MLRIDYIVFASLLFIACDNDDNDKDTKPTRTELIAKTWVFNEVTRRIVFEDGSEKTEDHDLTDSDYEKEFRIDGTFETRNDGNTFPGKWNFSGDDEETLNLIFDADTTTTHTSTIVTLTSTEFTTTHTVDYDIDEDGVMESVTTVAKHSVKN